MKPVSMGSSQSNPGVFDLPDYKRSRLAYLFECAFECFASLLVSDSLLAYLLSYLGMSESLVGIVSSLVSPAFLFELFAVVIVGRIRNQKRFVIFFHTLGNFFFFALLLIPFFPFPASVRIPISIICILAAYFGNYLVTSMIYNWGNGFVKPERRAEFSSAKEMVALLGGLIISIALGFIMGCYRDADDPEGWFIFSAVVVFIFSACDLICLLLIRKPVEQTHSVGNSGGLKDSLEHTFGNRGFVRLLILNCLWKCAVYCTVGFMGSYKNLLFSLEAVQVINGMGSLFRFSLSKPLGRFSDRYSYSNGISLGFLLAAVAFGVNIFATPDTRWPAVVFTLFYSACLAATNQNMLNITYNFVPSEYFVQASAIKNSISGLCGFGASIVSGWIMSAIQANDNLFFGSRVYGQQLLSAVSFALVILCLVFNLTVIRRQKTIGR